jgi:hypothetical protein
MSKNASLGAYGIMYVVRNRKGDVLGLLLKNGVVVPSNASDMTIALAVTNLLKVSKSFYLEFTKLLISEDTVMSMSANMSGSYANVDGFSFNPKTFKPLDLGGYGNSTTSTTTPPKSTTPAKSTSGNVSWLNQGLELLQTGFQGYLQLDDNKTKRELADASVKISSDEITKKEDAPPPKGLSTGAIVGISLLGVTVVGLVIYLVVKNKNQ